MGPHGHGLEGDARLVWLAWFTRSDDGWIPRRPSESCSVSLGSGWSRTWVQLLGEYVIEISTDIADFVEARSPTIRAGRRHSPVLGRQPGFVTLTLPAPRATGTSTTDGGWT